METNTTELLKCPKCDGPLVEQHEEKPYLQTIFKDYLYCEACGLLISRRKAEKLNASEGK